MCARTSAGLDIRGEGDEPAVLTQNGAHGDDQRFDLPLDWRVMRRFEYDFERDRIDSGRSGQNAFIMVVYDAIPGGESIDDRIDVSRQNFAGFGEGGAKQIFGQRVSADKTIKAVAGVIGMELNNAIEMGSAKIVFENFNFGFD